jgi:hypothetical protein
MLMMHGVEFDADKITGTYPKDKDGRDIAPKGYLERARHLSARIMSFLAERNERRAAANARKRSASGAPSSKGAGSSAYLSRCLYRVAVIDFVVPCRRLLF